MEEIRAPVERRLRNPSAALRGAWPAVALALCLLASSHAGDLERGFVHPPDSARPWVYWMWMDGNLGREGLTADLEAMQRAGIGGAIVMEVDVGIPRGPVKFMSPEWRQLFSHVVREAERLGLQITLNAGPGWTGSGGPWVMPEQSMQHLVASVLEVQGPTNLNTTLPRPTPRPPYFGTDGLPPELIAAQTNFLADVAVLAFPTPSLPAAITDIDEKALYRRDPFSSMKGVKPFLSPPADLPAAAPGSAIDPAAMVDLTDRLQPNGRLAWNAPPGRWTLLRFSRTSTGANTRPAPAPGLGLESDKFDRAALEAHYDHFVGTLLRDLGPNRRRDVGWTSLHIDSWEMGAQNWTAAFRSEFRRRRGYDPLPYLPVITGRVVENLEVSERFLWDLRQTAQELVLENHAGHLKTLGRRDGFALSIEPYDMNPTADLELGAVADVPMCEFWSNCFETWYSCFEAVSIAHTAGRAIAAAESFTADDQERWRQYPGSLKSLADWAFCTGINRLVVHRYAHQPWLDRAPGMTMGPYGVHWDRTQTWWSMADAFHRYLARCQWMLRRGNAIADILYLTPEGAPHVFRPPTSAVIGNPPDHRGHPFDACSPGTLLARARVEDGQIAFPGGTTYRILVLPNIPTMTPGLLRKIAELVRAGATVVGNPPRQSPSLSQFPECDTEVRELARDLWGENSTTVTNTARSQGRGRIVSLASSTDSGNSSDLYPDYAALAAFLESDATPPDFECDGPFRYNHRRDADADLYFVANRDAARRVGHAVFRSAEGTPELWFPLTGQMHRVEDWSRQDGRARITLTLEAHESVFVVFRNHPDPPPAAGSRGETVVLSPDIPGPWTVRFQPGRGAPATVTFAELADWSRHSDPGIRFFSGTATYEGAFNWQPTGGTAQTIFLDLGRVEVMARVRLNGRDLGVLWTPPFRVEVTDSLQAGANRLEVTVANLWPNRLIGDAALPTAERIAWTTWNPFGRDDALLPSGWLGPATLLSTASTAPADSRNTAR